MQLQAPKRNNYLYIYLFIYLFKLGKAINKSLKAELEYKCFLNQNCALVLEPYL